MYRAFPLFRDVHTGKSIGGTVVDTWAVSNDDLELGQSFGVTDLAFTESTLLGEVLKILVVCQTRAGWSE